MISSYWNEGFPILAKTQNFYPFFFKIEGEQSPRVIMDQRDIIMLGSNNYLGMTSHPLIKQKVIEAIEEFGVGTTGSRLFNGTMELHIELEKRLARFLGTEECVVYSTGMQANLGAISSIMTGDDEWVISDKSNHASIIDGMRLGRTSPEHRLIYEHCNMEDLQAKLEMVPFGKGIIITEGIFSMEGDVAPLDRVVELARKFDAMVYVDDAHGLGVMGDHGRGTVNHFKGQGEVDFIMGTFSKSFASVGGFIGGSKETCNWLKHKSRTFLFSASPPPSTCATVLAILDIIEKDDSLQKNLLKVSDMMRKGLRDAGFNVGNSKSAVIPIIIGERMKMFNFFKSLFYETPTGIFTNPVIPPVVPEGQELLRTSYMATMDEELINLALEIISKVGKETNIV